MKNFLQNKLLLVLGIAFLALAILLLTTCCTCCLQKTQKPQEVIESKTELVAGFPQLPQHPQATLIDSSKEETEEGDNYQGVWESSDPVPQLVRWYQNKLVEAGWTIDVLPADSSAQDLQFLVFRKKEKVVNILNLSFVQKEDKAGTIITAEIFPEPE